MLILLVNLYKMLPSVKVTFNLEMSLLNRACSSISKRSFLFILNLSVAPVQSWLSEICPVAEKQINTKPHSKVKKHLFFIIMFRISDTTFFSYLIEDFHQEHTFFIIQLFNVNSICWSSVSSNIRFLSVPRSLFN